MLLIVRHALFPSCATEVFFSHYLVTQKKNSLAKICSRDFLARSYQSYVSPAYPILKRKPVIRRQKAVEKRPSWDRPEIRIKPVLDLKDRDDLEVRRRGVRAPTRNNSNRESRVSLLTSYFEDLGGAGSEGSPSSNLWRENPKSVLARLNSRSEWRKSLEAWKSETFHFKTLALSMGFMQRLG